MRYGVNTPLSYASNCSSDFHLEQKHQKLYANIVFNHTSTSPTQMWFKKCIFCYLLIWLHCLSTLGVIWLCMSFVV